ncbi:hypothetical protein EXIGLDRAFT_696691 [Exidia glandulosa HHB12029]|uniref:Glycosyltransferase 61 catalytic domain-containing protein n=1 Tax=Exidia glandulosa HHB12029 TaxID=1314781 RepID=A0A165F678_EXIGL|nr:hypothetical protein EXIGLDRAFT_696691 [Exidia glandulosa HHB12029]
MGYRDRIALYCAAALATSFFISNVVMPMWRGSCGLRVSILHDDAKDVPIGSAFRPVSSSSLGPWYRPYTASPAPTRILNHAAGWTIFENLYMSNGTFFVVRDLSPEELPEKKFVLSRSNFSYDNYYDFKAREPTDEDLQYITPAEAARRWEYGAWGISGNTWIFPYPPVTLLRHYYHACAETFLGAWRFWTGTFDPNVTPSGLTKAPPINRMIFPFNGADEWKDFPRLNAFFLFSAWPGLTVEEKDQWADRVFLTRTGDKAWVYERVLLHDRAATSRELVVYPKERKIAAVAYEATLATSSPFWWEPVRRSVLQFSGVDKEIIDLALRYEESDTPVITYISRQRGRRRKLRDADHDKLVLALEQLAVTRGWEFSVVDAQDMPPEKQLEIFARSTILLGVHGNGLTHMMFMPPVPKATVIELFYPGGLTHDYEWPARRAFQFKHFAVWNDTYYTYPHPPHVKIGFPEGQNGDGGFQGNNIPVNGETVARLIEMRLDGKL